MQIRSVAEIQNLENTRVLLRLDMNVPIHDCQVLDNSRILYSLETLRYLLRRGAYVNIITHIGRPSGFTPKLSVNCLIPELEKLLGIKIHFKKDFTEYDKYYTLEDKHRVTLFENIRFYNGEEENCMQFAHKLSMLGDVYVNEAFSCSHRAHASISRIPKILPAYAGFNLIREISFLDTCIDASPESKMIIIGGSKVSTKLDVLRNLVNKTQYLFVGGAMANTFLKAAGFEVGISLVEEDYLNIASEIMKHQSIMLPNDLHVLNKYGETEVRKVKEIKTSDNILDIGPASVTNISHILPNIQSLLWNGPLGFFEKEPFNKASSDVANIILDYMDDGRLSAVIGGGDTIASINKAGVDIAQFTHVSTAGGAFLDYISGIQLPGIKALMS